MAPGALLELCATALTLAEGLFEAGRNAVAALVTQDSKPAGCVARSASIRKP